MKNNTTILFLAIVFFTSNCKRKETDINATDYYSNIIADANKISNGGNKVKALHYLDSAYNASTQPKSIIDMLNKYKTKHTYYFQSAYFQPVRKYELAMLYADSTIWLLEKNQLKDKLPNEYARALFSKGDDYLGMKKFSLAYEYFYNARQIATKTGDQCAIGDYSYRLGMLSYKEGKYSFATAYFKQAFAEMENCKAEFTFFSRRQELLSNIGLSLHKAGYADSALKYYDKAITFIQENKSVYKNGGTFFDMALGVVYGNQAKAYQEKKLFDSAEILLKKSIDINSKLRYDNRDAQLSRLQLVSLYFDKNELPNAFALLQETRIGLDTLHNENGELLWRRLMWKYNDAVNDTKSSLEALRSYVQLTDSLDKQNVAFLKSDIDIQLENLEKQYQINLLKKDNKVQELYLWIAIIVAITGVLIVSLLLLFWKRSKRNVKELEQLNERINQHKTQLEQTLQELEVQVNEKDGILRVVAHDLRNPIGGISSLIDMVIEKNNQGQISSSENYKILEMIKATTSDSLNMIHELLDYSTAQNNKTLNKQTLDINILVSECVELLQHKASAKQQQIFWNYTQQLLIEADREKLWRVVANLISNAVKFSRENTQITVSTSLQHNKVLITIKDQGIGIPKGLQPQIFDVFTKAKRSGTNGEQAFGLGLSISKQIIELHDGKIWFETIVNEGTTFFIELPVK